VSFEDRLAVVTGAASGIGRQTAHAFARGGGAIVNIASGADFFPLPGFAAYIA